MITMWHMTNTTHKQALANKALASEALAKVPEVTLIFLADKNSCHNAWRNGWRRRFDVDELRLFAEHGNFCGDFYHRGDGAN